jgi:hypothetical protein
MASPPSHPRARYRSNSQSLGTLEIKTISKRTNSDRQVHQLAIGLSVTVSPQRTLQRFWLCFNLLVLLAGAPRPRLLASVLSLSQAARLPCLPPHAHVVVPVSITSSARAAPERLSSAQPPRVLLCVRIFFSFTLSTGVGIVLGSGSCAPLLWSTFRRTCIRHSRPAVDANP